MLECGSNFRSPVSRSSSVSLRIFWATLGYFDVVGPKAAEFRAITLINLYMLYFFMFLSFCRFLTNKRVHNTLLKVILNFDNNRMPVCDCLCLSNSNLHSILHRFQDIVDLLVKFSHSLGVNC